MDNIDYSVLERYFKIFQETFGDVNGHISFTGEGRINEEEGYKTSLYQKYFDRRKSENWQETDVSDDAGKIYLSINSAIRDSQNNLVNPYQKTLFTNWCRTDMRKAQQILYDVYYSTESEEEVFENVNTLFRHRYDLISFIYFLKDSDRFLPVKGRYLDGIFKALHIDFKMEGRCSWKNYQIFISIARRIQDAMISYFAINVRLIDVQSFLWMIGSHGLGEYQEVYALQIASDIEHDDVETEVIRTQKQRIGQQTFKEKLMQYWNQSCSVTGCDFSKALIASHIKPWAVSDSQERLNVNNGLLLTPNLDRLFDSGYITFSDTGKIVISNAISKENLQRLNVNKDMMLRKTPNKEQKKYLDYHRKNIFINEAM